MVDNVLTEKVLKYYKEWGYRGTMKHIHSMFDTEQIVLTEKARLQDLITEIEMKPKRNKRKK